jgi:hypothetical protein
MIARYGDHSSDSSVRRHQARRYLRQGGWDIDLRHFRKTYNPTLRHYDCTFAAFLRGSP